MRLLLELIRAAEILGAEVVALAAIAGAVLYLTFEKVPWWRKTASPRRLVRDVRDHWRAWKRIRKHPEAFEGYVLPGPPEQPTSGGDT